MWKLEYLSLDFKPKTSKKLGNNPSSVPEALSMSPFYVITLFSVSQYFFLLATAEVLFLPNSGCGHFFESSSSAPESSSGTWICKQPRMSNFPVWTFITAIIFVDMHI